MERSRDEQSRAELSRAEQSQPEQRGYGRGGRVQEMRGAEWRGEGQRGEEWRGEERSGAEWSIVERRGEVLVSSVGAVCSGAVGVVTGRWLCGAWQFVVAGTGFRFRVLVTIKKGMRTSFAFVLLVTI